MPNNGLYRDGTQGKRPHYTHNRGNKTSVSTIDDVKKCKGCLNGGWNGMTFPDPPPCAPSSNLLLGNQMLFHSVETARWPVVQNYRLTKGYAMYTRGAIVRETVLYGKKGMYSHVRYFPLFID
jgi:hypothetical protein